jgi:hypothetical protein
VQRPDTFSQTASRPTQFVLHSGGGPYMFHQPTAKERYFRTIWLLVRPALIPPVARQTVRAIPSRVSPVWRVRKSAR